MDGDNADGRGALKTYPISKLLHKVVMPLIFEGAIEIDNVWVHKAGVEMDLPFDLMGG